MKQDEFLDKLVSGANKLDLSRDEDLSIALMNLISLEEHLYFTAQKIDSDDMLRILAEVRKIRTKAMQNIVIKGDGEEWCISKHLLASSMRLIETGNKYLNKDKKKAENYFDDAFSLYSLFWQINMKIEQDSYFELKEEESTTTNEEEADYDLERVAKKIETNDTGSGWLDRIKKTVSEVVDCCIER